MQFQILPMVSGIAEVGEVTGGTFGTGATGGAGISQEEISGSFLYLMLIQGFFTGLTIGKLSTESVKEGIKHSFTLMIISFIVSQIANLIF